MIGFTNTHAAWTDGSRDWLSHGEKVHKRNKQIQQELKEMVFHMDSTCADAGINPGNGFASFTLRVSHSELSHEALSIIGSLIGIILRVLNTRKHKHAREPMSIIANASSQPSIPTRIIYSIFLRVRSPSQEMPLWQRTVRIRLSRAVWTASLLDIKIHQITSWK